MPINHDAIRWLQNRNTTPSLDDDTFWSEFDREMSRDASMPDKTQNERSISDFDLWVANNNPDIHFEYGKAWWDYVEIIQRLVDKFNATDARVIGTYVVYTPPPEEELPMPAVAFVVGSVAFAVKWDFGRCPRWPHQWTVSIQRTTPHRGSTLHLFDEHTDVRDVADGFGPDFTFPPYADSPQRFTCVVDDELDVAAILRIFSQPAE